MDVVDPGMAPGTGTPEPGGLTARQLLDAVRRCAYELPIVGVDVVEVAPPYDHADITAFLGNRVVLEVLSAMARRRRDDAERHAPGIPPSPSSTAADPTQRASRGPLLAFPRKYGGPCLHLAQCDDTRLRARQTASAT